MIHFYFVFLTALGTSPLVFAEEDKTVTCDSLSFDHLCSVQKSNSNAESGAQLFEHHHSLRAYCTDPCGAKIDFDLQLEQSSSRYDDSWIPSYGEEGDPSVLTITALDNISAQRSGSKKNAELQARIDALNKSREVTVQSCGTGQRSAATQVYTLEQLLENFNLRQDQREEHRISHRIFNLQMIRYFLTSQELGSDAAAREEYLEDAEKDAATFDQVLALLPQKKSGGFIEIEAPEQFATRRKIDDSGVESEEQVQVSEKQVFSFTPEFLKSYPEMMRSLRENIKQVRAIQQKQDELAGPASAGCIDVRKRLGDQVVGTKMSETLRKSLFLFQGPFLNSRHDLGVKDAPATKPIRMTPNKEATSILKWNSDPKKCAPEAKQEEASAQEVSVKSTPTGGEITASLLTEKGQLVLGIQASADEQTSVDRLLWLPKMGSDANAPVTVDFIEKTIHKTFFRVVYQQASQDRPCGFYSVSDTATIAVSVTQRDPVSTKIIPMEQRDCGRDQPFLPKN